MEMGDIDWAARSASSDGVDLARIPVFSDRRISHQLNGGVKVEVILAHRHEQQDVASSLDLPAFPVLL